MSTQTPELDTARHEYPAAATNPPPAVGETAIAWVQVAGATAVVNLVVYVAAVALGAEMTVDLGVFEQVIGPAAVIAASLGTLFVSTFAWSIVAHRVPAFAHLWVALGWGVGLVSLGGILGAAGMATGIALAVMHVLTTAVASHVVPRRLPR